MEVVNCKNNNNNFSQREKYTQSITLIIPHRQIRDTDRNNCNILYMQTCKQANSQLHMRPERERERERELSLIHISEPTRQS